MSYAGEYPDRMLRKVRSVTKNSMTGQEEESFEDGSYLWCRIELTQGRRQDDYGTTQTGSTGTIYVRNYPTLSALDRLYSVEWDELYVIESIYRGDNELICDVYQFDELELSD